MRMDWIEKDLRYIWHPCSQMKDYEKLKPIIIERGEGAYLYDIEGKKYLDIISSWWCNLFGHCNPLINAAVKEQLERLEHVIFANFSHKGAIHLCGALMNILPKGLKKFHFSDNGSSSVECALKMSFQFALQTGRARKQKFVCLSEGYHGETIGALSVGSMDLYAKMYKPMLMESVHIEAPDCYRCPYGKHRDTCRCDCFAKVEEAFAKYGAETCAIIVEPILQGSAGMRIYPALYLKKLRELCNAYDVLFIADEIATGFGRTGKMFAVDHAGVTPDIMCISKGLTGGYLPMSITVTTQEIYDAFYADYLEGKAFLHSHTYSGNPLGCAAALAVQKIFQTEDVFGNMTKNERYLTEEMTARFGAKPYIGEIRHIGLIHALELVKDKQAKTAFDAKERIGYQIYQEGLRQGILLRPLGDVIYFNPPLNIKKSELIEGLEKCQAAIQKVLE